jgi:hypothetical protein
MNDKLKSEIDTLFNGYEARKAEQQKKSQAQKQKEDRFLKEFYSIREKVVKPAMEEIGEMLKARGQNCSIQEYNESIDHEGKTKDAQIGIYFLLPKEQHVSFIATRYKEKVWVHESTIGPTRGGHSGNAGEYPLEQITTELVQRKVMKVLKELFGK